MTIFRQLVYYVTQKAAANPEAQEKAVNVARGMIKKTQQIAKEDDPAYAAGRAVRQAFDKLRNKQ